MKFVTKTILVSLMSAGLSRADPAFYCSKKDNTELKRYGDFEIY